MVVTLVESNETLTLVESNETLTRSEMDVVSVEKSALLV